MKKLLLLLTTFCLTLSWGGCQELTAVYDSEKVVFNERDFEAIEISDLAAYVIIKKSVGYDITARGRNQELVDLKVEKQNKKLKITYKNQRYNRRIVRLEISLPNLNSVYFSGAVKGKSEGEFESDKFQIELHETSALNLSLKANEIISQAHGSSDLTLRGGTLVGLHTTQAFGTSKIEAYELPTRSTYIQVFGASKGFVNVSKDLIASADGVSKIRYKGKPKNVSAKTTGLSSINEM